MKMINENRSTKCSCGAYTVSMYKSKQVEGGRKNGKQKNSKWKIRPRKAVEQKKCICWIGPADETHEIRARTHKDVKTKLKKSVFPRLFIISQMVAKGAYTEKDNDENKAQKKERERGWDRVTVKNRSLMVRFVLFAFSYTFEPIQLASGQGWNLIIMNNVVVVCFKFPYSLFSAPVFRWGVKGGRGEGIVFVTQSSLVMDVC